MDPSNAPVNDFPQDLPDTLAPTTTFLSLPTELLLKIASEVAPNGGVKAGALRLACRHLAVVVESVVWASIVFRADDVDLEELLARLIRQNTTPSSVTSLCCEIPDVLGRTVPGLVIIPTLNNLRRLLIVGRSRFLPPALIATFQNLQHLRNLELDGVALSFDIPLLPHLRSLVLHRCTNTSDLFADEYHHPRMFNSVTSLDMTAATGLSAWRESSDVLDAIRGCPGAQEILVRWDQVSFPAQRAALGRPWSTVPEPVALRFIGLASVFTPGSSRSSTRDFLRFLDWLAARPVHTLSLPASAMLHFNTAFKKLALPDLRVLSFSTALTPSESYTLLPDYLSPTTDTNLFRFIGVVPLPSLRTLHLRGWFDTTTVHALSAIPPNRLLHGGYLCLATLLARLTKGTVTEVWLENSEGHDEEGEQCIYSREEGGREWEVKWVRRW